MKIQDLYEARRNPDLNRKENIIEKLLEYADDPNLFIHTTAVAKVGINPKSAKRNSDDTPAGIFTFQIQSMKDNLQYAKEHNQSLSMALPFIGGNNLFVLRSTVPFADTLTSYSESALDKHITELKKEYGDEVIESYRHIAPTNENFVNAPIGILWGITKAIAIGGTSELSHQQYPDAMVWNKVLRKLGLYALHDTGHGWIHNAEPTQSLFLDAGGFETVDHFVLNRKQPVIKIGGKKYKGGRLPKKIILNRIDDTELSNITISPETKQVREVVVTTTKNPRDVASLAYKFPNARLVIDKLIVDNDEFPPLSDTVEVNSVIFSQDFPRIPSMIKRLEDAKHKIKNIYYVPFTPRGMKQIIDAERYSPELFAKIKEYE